MSSDSAWPVYTGQPAGPSAPATGWPGMAREVTFWLPGNVVNLWHRWPNPRDGYNTNSWIACGREVQYRSNDGQALVAPARVTGNFTFQARVRSLGNDDDRLGLVFGWQDPDNHYRLSWEGNFGGGGYPEADGSRGLSLICEAGGTPVSLINFCNAFFRSQVPYDLAVWRSGSEIGMTIARVSDNAVMVHESVTNTTFLGGHCGLWNASQPTAYTDITLGPGPETAALADAALAVATRETAYRPEPPQVGRPVAGFLPLIAH